MQIQPITSAFYVELDALTAQQIQTASSVPIVHTMLTKLPLYALFAVPNASPALVPIQINVSTAPILNTSITKIHASTFRVPMENTSILSKVVLTVASYLIIVSPAQLPRLCYVLKPNSSKMANVCNAIKY